MAITKLVITVILFCCCRFFSSAQEASTPLLVISQYKFIVGDTLWYKIYFLDQYRNLVNGKNWIKINLIDNDGNSRYHAQLVVNDGLGRGQLQIPETQPGYYRLMAYDSSFPEKTNKVSSQVIVIVSADILLKSDSLPYREVNSQSAAVVLDKIDYKPRERVIIEMNSAMSSEFSISVTNADLLGGSQRNSIYDEVSAIRDFQNEKTKSKPNTNRMLEGYAFFNESNQPLPDSTTLLFYLQNSGWRFQTRTGKQGLVKLLIPDIQINDEFFYLAEVDGIVTSKINVQWMKTDIKWPKADDKALLGGLDKYAIYSSKKKIIDKSFHFYSNNKNQSNTVKRTTYNPIPVSHTIRTEDYELFPTMEEYIKEVLPSIFVRERNRTKVLRIKMRPPSPNQPPPNTTNDPIYFIDGMATNNTNHFLSLKPSEVNTIGIANDPRKLLPYGLLGKNGIILVETKRKNLRESLSDKSKILEALVTPVTFHDVSYEKNNETNFPDFRPVLYWNPSIKTDESGKARIEFYTSDDLGTFQLEILGFANKEPFWIKKYFEVRR